MANLRVVYMGTPEFAVPCLDMLIEEGYDIVAAVTQPDRRSGRGQKLAFPPVKERALAAGLPVLQPEKIKEPAFVDKLVGLRPDVIVVVAFGQILPQAVLSLPPAGCINVHASLLPRYRGAAPIHWAIINGEASTGITTMFMDAGLDTGDIILKAETGIRPDETMGQLHDRLKVIGAGLLADTLRLAAAGPLPRTKQDSAAASYAPLITRLTERIDWTKPASDLNNLVRGLNPWPGAFCHHRGRLLKVWRTQASRSQPGRHEPGRVVAVAEDSLAVATGAGVIELREVQPESKRRMTAGEFIRGYDLHVGEILE